ncbi:hypothetical protein [Planctomicrobium sp. SH527]|uniref:hypothetical protein n=1 Tax=Planctomicrobium sp. SH527 TaxID=3448123 RepID=UPI003F5C8DF5
MIVLVGGTLCGCPVAPPPKTVIPVEPPVRPASSSSAEPVELPSPETPLPSEDTPDPSQPALPASLPSSSQKRPEGQPRIPSPSPVSTVSSSEEAATLKKAKRLLNSARTKRNAGQYSAAFLEAREAWDLVQESGTPGGQQLASDVREELSFLAGKLTPSSVNPPNKFKTLILK